MHAYVYEIYIDVKRYLIIYTEPMEKHKRSYRLVC